MSRKKKGRFTKSATAQDSTGPLDAGAPPAAAAENGKGKGKAVEATAASDRTNGTQPDAPSQTDGDARAQRFRPIHGNFRNYYAIRGRSGPSSSSASAATQASAAKPWSAAGSGVVSASARDDIDLRLRQLLSWTVKTHAQLPYERILDIGCNSGQVTLELAEALEFIYGRAPVHVFGVDIDDELVSEARTALSQLSANGGKAGPPRKRRRKMEDLALPIPDQNHSIALFRPRQVKSSATKDTEKQLSTTSQSAAPSSSSIGEAPPPRFPGNVSFHTADWVKTGTSFAEEQASASGSVKAWDLILGLSLTKWVHINNGTEGMLRLFGRIATELRDPQPSATSASHNAGGVFLLEPQAWSSYKTARSQGADVRARIQALQHPAPLSVPVDLSGDKKGKRRRKKRKRDEAEDENGEAGPPPNGSGPVETERTYGYPPVSPDDFPFLLSVVLGLEGPIEIGEAHGAGFRRPLQVYRQADLAALPAARAEAIIRSREDAVRGTLVLSWAARQFK